MQMYGLNHHFDTLIPTFIIGYKWGQSIDCKNLYFFCFSTKHLEFNSKNKDWLAWKHDNVSKWKDLSIHRLLFL